MKLTEETRRQIYARHAHEWEESDWERNVYEEARNIAVNSPVFAGDTISHRTANECGHRGWAIRNNEGDWIPTEENPWNNNGELKEYAKSTGREGK